MALLKSLIAQGVKNLPSVSDSAVARLAYDYLTTGSLAAGDIIDLGPLPAGVDPKDVSLASDDLDTSATPTLTLSVGILNAAKTDLSAGANDTFIAASTVGQAGGIARATTAAVALLGAASTERRLGIKVVAGPATSAGAGKKISVLLDVAG